jgi:hypothetical protein
MVKQARVQGVDDVMTFELCMITGCGVFMVSAVLI